MAAEQVVKKQEGFPRGQNRWFWIRIGLLVLAGLGALWLVRQPGVDELLNREQLRALFERISNEPLAGPAFILLFALGLSSGLPGSAFILTGGIVFGVWPGALYNWLGCLLGASGAFVIARLLGRDLVRRLLGERLERLDAGMHSSGFWAVFTLRLIPVVPFNLSNFALGVTGVRYRDFVAATAVSMVPGLTITAWFAESLWEGAGGGEAYRSLFIATLLMLSLALIPWWIQRRRTRAAAQVLASSRNGNPPTEPES